MLKNFSIYQGVIQLAWILPLWFFLTYKIPYFFLQLITLDSVYSMFDVIIPSLTRYHPQLLRETSFIDRYLYILFIWGSEWLIEIATYSLLPDILKIFIALLTLPEIEFYLINRKEVQVVFDIIREFANKISHKTLCQVCATVINWICRHALQLNPEISRKEIAAILKDSSYKNLTLFIKIVILTHILKTIEEKISFARPFLKLLYNRGSFLPLPSSWKYEDTLMDIENRKDKIRIIINQRQFKQFFNPETLHILEQLFWDPNEGTFWKEVDKKKVMWTILTSKLCAIYTACNLFYLWSPQRQYISLLLLTLSLILMDYHTWQVVLSDVSRALRIGWLLKGSYRARLRFIWMQSHRIVMKYFDFFFDFNIKLVACAYCYISPLAYHNYNGGYLLAAILATYGELINNSVFWWVVKQTKKKIKKYTRVFLPFLYDDAKHLQSKQSYPNNQTLILSLTFVYVVSIFLGDYTKFIVLTGSAILSNFPVLVFFFSFLGWFSNYNLIHLLKLFVLLYFYINFQRYNVIPETIINVNMIENYNVKQTPIDEFIAIEKKRHKHDTAVRRYHSEVVILDSYL